jgi:cbb3-type cytochrome oxidase cytochrome c subunit
LIAIPPSIAATVSIIAIVAVIAVSALSTTVLLLSLMLLLRLIVVVGRRRYSLLRFRGRRRRIDWRRGHAFVHSVTVHVTL